MIKYLLSMLLFIAALLPTSIFAGTERMVFWYPGEAGSTEEAQPVIDLFLDYVNAKIAPDKLEGSYFNTERDGLAFVKHDRPVVGIISYSAWMQHYERLNKCAPILSTLPLPRGQDKEQYVFVGAGKTIDPELPILVSEPLTMEFVRKHLFPSLPEQAKLTNSTQLLFHLQQIGQGKRQGQAILTPMEAKTLSLLTTDWAKKINVIATSKPVSTARVVLFDESWSAAERFKAALLGANTDSKAKAILEEMRLKGFAKITLY